MRRYGFTLIELLIVVAIIAILAAIAVPNFLEAQTRAKVSRCQADMRTMATALETYHVDHNKPMTCRTDLAGSLTGPSLVNSALAGNTWVSYRFKRLTTPIAYLTQVLPDVFAKNGKTVIIGNPSQQSSNYDTFDYFDEFFDNRQTNANWRGAGLTSGGSWRIASPGPDNVQGFGGAIVGNTNNHYGVDYDASNGTVSRGDLVRVGGSGGINPSQKPSIDRVRGTINDPALR